MVNFAVVLVLVLEVVVLVVVGLTVLLVVLVLDVVVLELLVLLELVVVVPLPLLPNQSSPNNLFSCCCGRDATVEARTLSVTKAFPMATMSIRAYSPESDRGQKLMSSSTEG